MRERVHALLGIAPRGMLLCTFHSFGLRVLRKHGHRLNLSPKATIYGTDEQIKLIEEILDQVDPEGYFSAVNLLSRISAAKNRGLTPEALLARNHDELTRRAVLVYARYEEPPRAVCAGP